MNLLTLDFQVSFRELDEIFRKLLNILKFLLLYYIKFLKSIVLDAEN